MYYSDLLVLVRWRPVLVEAPGFKRRRAIVSTYIKKFRWDAAGVDEADVVGSSQDGVKGDKESSRPELLKINTMHDGKKT